MKIINSALIMIMFLACSCSNNQVENSYPKSRAEKKREQAGGGILGEGGLFGMGHDKSSGSGINIGVNSYLWRASLDAISFMPLLSADPFGGVIITDWYEDPNTQNERLKINIMILSSVLTVEGVKVSVFKQVYDKKMSSWHDFPVASQTARMIEDEILTKARKLKIANEHR